MAKREAKEDGKVTVIVAFYNSEKFIRKCIDSVLDQTYQNLEIILVDDGSPDKCGEICDEYAKKDKRIQVIHKRNGGVCEARNYGLKRASGEYIVIIDGDDWLEKDYVEYLMKIVKKTGAEMALTTNIFTTRDREQVKEDKIEVWTPEEAFCGIIYPVVPIGPWNKIYSAKMLKDNNITFTRPWSGEGLVFTAIAAQCANKVGVGKRKIYNYRLNNAGSGLTNPDITIGTHALENTIWLDKHRTIKTKKTTQAIRWRQWANYLFVAEKIVETGTMKENRELYNDCIRKAREMMWRVAARSDVSLKSKAGIILKSMFPMRFIERTLKRKRAELAKDLKQLAEEGA